MRVQTVLLFFRIDTFTPQKPIMTLYTKDPCPLCDILKNELIPYKDKFELKTIDITASGNLKWLRLYRYEIPVLFFNGEFLCKHRLDKNILEIRLKEYEENKQS